MESKAWYQSKTIAMGIGAACAALVPFLQAVGAWIDSGHTISGAVGMLWPAAVILFGALAAIFRAGATTTIK